MKKDIMKTVITTIITYLVFFLIIKKTIFTIEEIILMFVILLYVTINVEFQKINKNS